MPDCPPPSAARARIAAESTSANVFFRNSFSREEIGRVFQKHGLTDAWSHKRWLQSSVEFHDAQKFVAAYILEHFPPEAKILDVACGAGNMSCFLAELGFTNLHGFDSEEKVVAVARDFAALRGPGVNFYVADALHPPSGGFHDVECAFFLGWLGCSAGFNAAAAGRPLEEAVTELLLRYGFPPGTHVLLDVYNELSNSAFRKKNIGHYVNGAAIFEHLTAGHREFVSAVSGLGYELRAQCYDHAYGIKVVYAFEKTA